VSAGRWGFYPCSYEVFGMLKELNKLWQKACRQAAAWRRWNRKLPHNRVRRPVLRDAHNRKVGYGPPTALSEPELDARFCQRRNLPSGRVDVILSNRNLEAAYRLARYPKPTGDQVTPLPIDEKEIRDLYQRCCEPKE
jgi:hypothetical protein